MKIKEILRSILPGCMIGLYHKARCRGEVIVGRIRFAVSGAEIADPKQIPIIINNYNRLAYLEQLIGSLTARGYNNIYIIDNNSTYPPLLEYYRTTPYTVFRLNSNVGYLALWKTGIFKKFRKSYYVYTDSDMCIDEGCPHNFMQHFLELHKKYKMAQKVGFGLRIDDLPDCFKNKDKVIGHESRFWETQVEKSVYKAEIDTTFALYKPFCGGKADRYQQTYRTGFPYVIRHLPWYVDSANPDPEELYYVNSVTQSTHWTKEAK